MTLPPTTPKHPELAARTTLATVLIVVGLAVIALSFVWPTKAVQRAAWSLEQAEQYQAAQHRLHGLEKIAPELPAREQSIREEIKAKADYNKLRGQLDAAIARPRRWAWILRIVGLLAALIGSARLIMLPMVDSGPG